MNIDILGTALLDFYHNRYTEDIITYSSLDEEDVLPLPYLFRAYDKMPVLEQKALALCKGTILDIGCGAGNHSLYLQDQGLKVTALDQSEGAIAVCRERGIKSCHRGDIFTTKVSSFDTLLLLMNGIGIVGVLKNIDVFLKKLKLLLNPDGQILLDSSDIIYMFETDEDGGHWIPDNTTYYGEVRFTMAYKGLKSNEFPWLYLDFNTLQRAADFNGLVCELAFEGEHYDYLARLTLKG